MYLRPSYQNSKKKEKLIDLISLVEVRNEISPKLSQITSHINLIILVFLFLPMSHMTSSSLSSSLVVSLSTSFSLFISDLLSFSLSLDMMTSHRRKHRHFHKNRTNSCDYSIMSKKKKLCI